jgi:single-strand DNA-binding protein
MNKVILMGRLTRDPEIRYTQGERQMAIARYSLAVNRSFRRDGEPDADFINCVAFGRQAEFAEKHLKKGVRIVITGRIQTGSYTNRDGVRVYTTDIIVEEQEFAESKAASDRNAAGFAASAPAQNAAPARPAPAEAVDDGFMNIPESIDEELPFS